MSGPVAFVKEHPIATGASVLVIALVVFVLPAAGGGSQQVSSGASPDTVAANTQLTMAQFADNQNQRETASAQTVALAGIASQDRALTLAAQVQSQKNVLDSTVALQTVNSQTQRDLAATEANRQIGLGAQQAAVAQTYYTTDASVRVAQANANAQVAVAQTQAKASKHNSNNSLIGSIAGGIIGLFSDSRLKTAVQYLYTDVEGVRWYRFKYTLQAQNMLGVDGAWHTGVLAQELRNTKFRGAVGVRRGFYTVDYSKLPARRQYA